MSAWPLQAAEKRTCWLVRIRPEPGRGRTSPLPPDDTANRGIDEKYGAMPAAGASYSILLPYHRQLVRTNNVSLSIPNSLSSVRPDKLNHRSWAAKATTSRACGQLYLSCPTFCK